MQIDFEDLINVTFIFFFPLGRFVTILYLYLSNHNQWFQLPLFFQYKNLDEEFLRRITENTRRYIGIFADAIDELLPEPTEAFIDDDHDILMTQRSDEGTEGADGADPRQKMPPEIKRFL